LESRPWLLSNLEAGRQLVSDLGRPISGAERSQPVWRNIPWQTVDAFLSRYCFDPRGSNEIGAIRQYIQAQARQQELVEWTVSIRGLSSVDENLGVEPLLMVGGHSISRISRSRKQNPINDIGSLVNPVTRNAAGGDEEIGLSSEQLALARAEVNDDFPRALRTQRSRREGLLLLYPISPNSVPRGSGENRLPLFEEPSAGCTVLGVAISFPVSDSAATIEYVVGSVGSAGGS